uniref:Uncharacterized protein n=1 Tax=Anguilla anguilla TaxID=7936 RepID=A0A0E9U3P0_ANGAN
MNLVASLKRSSTVSGWLRSPLGCSNSWKVGMHRACNMSSRPCLQPSSIPYSSTRILPRYRKQECGYT